MFEKDSNSKTKKTEKKSSKLGKLLIGVAISILALWWTLRSVEYEKILEALKQVDFSYIVLAFLVTALSYILRSVRWPYFMAKAKLAWSDSFRCLIVGFFMNNILPARMGELVRAHLGGKATNQSRSLVLASIAGERLADGIAISLLFGVLFYFFSQDVAGSSADDVFIVALLFLAAGIATACLLFVRNRIFNLLERIGLIMPGHLSSYTLKRIRKFIEGLEPMLEPRRLFIITIWSGIVWGVELFVYYLVTQAFNVDLPLGVLAFFLAVVNFSSLIPAAPGGIGVIEALATAALVSVGVEREVALSMVAVQHLIQIAVVGIPGSYFFFLGMHGQVPEGIDDIDDSDDPAFMEVSEGGRDIEDDVPIDSKVDISIVIPAYNEENRLPQTLIKVLDYFDSRDDEVEVLIVDDGSQDKTAELVVGLEKISDRIKLLTYPNNKGKGYAVRFGVHNAQGKFILYSDADGASPIEEIERLEAGIKTGAHIAIGSRAMFSRDTEISTVWYRKFMGRVFNGFVNFLILPGIADTQCGFKLFHAQVAKKLFSLQKADGFSFDVEILYLARREGYKIVEVPINWTNVPGSKVDLVKDSLKMGLDIIRFRLKGMVGGYKKPTSF